MTPPDQQPYWLETLELTIAAMITALARGVAWYDPATGAFSLRQTVQALATAAVIAMLAAAGQSYWNFPWPITAGVSVFGALVGLPVIITAANGIAVWGLQRIGVKQSGDSNAKLDRPNDKP